VTQRSGARRRPIPHCLTTYSPVAIITGGSRGIGLGIAEALAKEGWSLTVNGMRAQADVLGELDRLRALGADVAYCRGDVADHGARLAIVEETRQRFGRLHLLVNNAGITSPGRLDILEATEEAFDRVMDVNLKGAFHLTQLAARWMIDQRKDDPNFIGTIINISSVSGEFASVNRGDYCISWACLSETTKAWAITLAEYGIGVYDVRPGIIRTDMTSGVSEKYDRLIAEGLTTEPRWGTPEDVGRTVAVLARGEITYATGNAFYVDGGLSMMQRL